MLTKKIINNIKNKIKKHFTNISPSHNWTHVERVLNMALKIGKKEKANLDIIKIASYLHDIGRKDLKEKNYDHAIKGAIIASKILKNHKIDQVYINNICHCIKTHRFRSIYKPKTIEAKCIYDADKLDVLGAIGIARSYIYLGETKNGTIYKKSKKKKQADIKRTNSLQEEYENKYKHLPKKMYTKTGKKIAMQRLQYMKSFLKRLEMEVFGKM